MDKDNNHTVDDTTPDRISELPEFIVHHIFSYLKSPRYLVRCSVISKKWFGLTASFPILDFDIVIFMKFIESSWVNFRANKDKTEAFFKYTEYTRSRFCDQDVSLHTVNLYTGGLQATTDVHFINRCLESIIRKGVQVLVVDKINRPYVRQPSKLYCLPNILLSASSLTSLMINNCELPLSVMVDVVNLKSLKLLHLYRGTLDDGMITCLTANCSLLEELIIEFCYGFERFSVNRLLNLHKVVIHFRSELERIDFEAPNVSYLVLGYLDGRGQPCMNLASYKKLTTLYYFGYPSPTSEGLIDRSSNFPFLETLSLDLPEECKSLNLSSHSLRTFELYSNLSEESEFDLEKIDISTPRLLLFHYTDNCFSTKRDLAPSKACMECHLDKYVESSFFRKLRRFFDKHIGFKELKLHINVGCIDFGGLRVIRWPPFELDRAR